MFNLGMYMAKSSTIFMDFDSVQIKRLMDIYL